MTYEKFHEDWKNKPSKDTPIDDEALEHFEEGIFQAHELIDGLVPKSVADARGDILVATGADTVSRKPVGADGTLLVADSNNSTGLRWATLTSLTQKPALDIQVVAGELAVVPAYFPPAGVYVPLPTTYYHAIARVGTAPVGADLEITCLVNDESAFDITIPDGDAIGGVTFGDPITLTDGDIITFIITQVGSDTAGSDLAVTLATYLAP